MFLREDSREHARMMRTVRGVIAICLLLGATVAATYHDHDRKDHDRRDDDRKDHDRKDHDQRDRDRDDTLLVWGSDKAHVAPDFLAVINFDRDSRHYGKVIADRSAHRRQRGRQRAASRRPLPRRQDAGAGRPAQRAPRPGPGVLLRRHATRAILSSSARTIRRARPSPTSSSRSKNGGFLVTFMGGGNGAKPGRVGRVRRRHAIRGDVAGVNPSAGRFQSARRRDRRSAQPDDHQRLHLSAPHAPRARRRRGATCAAASAIWDLEDRSITKTIAVGDPARPAGTMEVKLIPRDRRLRAYTAGMIDSKLYLVDPEEGTAAPVFDFEAFATGGVPSMPQLLRINRDGTRMFVTLNGAGKVVMLDITRPNRPRPLSVVNLGADAGPHYLRLDERRAPPGGERLLPRRGSGAGRHRERGRRSQDPRDQRQRRSPGARPQVRRRFRSRHQHRARAPAWRGRASSTPPVGSRRRQAHGGRRGAACDHPAPKLKRVFCPLT